MRNSIITLALFIFSLTSFAQSADVEAYESAHDILYSDAPTYKSFPVVMGNITFEMNHLELGRLLMGFKTLDVVRIADENDDLLYLRIVEKDQ